MQDDRNGDWLDKHGHCKVCDGAIPYGHTDNCDIYKLEREIARLKQGECIKCNAGADRASCAYPESCEHPGRKLALQLNQALLKLADWEQFHIALVYENASPELKTAIKAQPLWPNSWHQDCAATAFFCDSRNKMMQSQIEGLLAQVAELRAHLP